MGFRRPALSLTTAFINQGDLGKIEAPALYFKRRLGGPRLLELLCLRPKPTSFPALLLRQGPRFPSVWRTWESHPRRSKTWYCGTCGCTAPARWLGFTMP